MTLRMHLGIGIAALSIALAVSAPAFSDEPAGAAIKRTAAGHPDFSGSWSMRPPSGPPKVDPRGICAGPACARSVPPAGAAPAAAAPVRAAPSFPKYKPELVAKVAQLNKEQVTYDPALRCQNPGLPRIGTPDKIVQTASEMIILYDDLNGAFWRIIPIDGRPHRDDAEENYLGDSVGKWDGDKLVIETRSFSDASWLTDNGAFHSAEMTVVEELSPKDGKVDYKLTVNDPSVLAEPWVKTATLYAAKSDPIEPVPCVEQSIGRMTGIDSYHPNPRW